MPVSTTFTLAAAGDIGYARIQDNNVAPTPGSLMAAESGATYGYGSSVLYTFDSGGGGGTNFSMQESFLRWNTASLAGYNVISAVLRVIAKVAVGTGNIGGRWLTGSTGFDRWNGGVPIIGDVDYNRGASIIADNYGGAGWTDLSVVDIPLIDVTGINTSGYTRLAMFVDEEYAGVGITDTQQFAFYGFGTGQTAPRLIVTHSATTCPVRLAAP